MCVQGRVSEDGHTWFAQNWDWIGRQRTALVILKTHDAQGRALTTLTEAGMLAKIGMNASGFALGLNILRYTRDGLIPCADAHGEVACFEIAPAGWAELTPDKGVVVHTNHFMCIPLLGEQSPMGLALSSQPRLDTAAEHAAQQGLGFDKLQAFLRDESDGYLSVCRNPDPSLPPEGRVESVAGVIMNTHPRQIWIAPDVPSKVAFQVIDNDWR